MQKNHEGFQVKVIAASIFEGNRVVTMQLRYPRIIHAEFMTHRVFSRNAGSSRAIPTTRMLYNVINDPAMPTEWGKNQKGMQSAGDHNELIKIASFLDPLYLQWHNEVGGVCDPEAKDADGIRRCGPEIWWHFSAWLAAQMSQGYSDAGYHKQVANRLTEPYQWMNTVMTATDWDNFFELRVHPDADPTFQVLAGKMKDAYFGTELKVLKEGEWHLPYIFDVEYEQPLSTQLALSTARCARVSYEPFDGNASVDKEKERHDLLVGSKPWHASPTEHQCTPMSGRHGNLNHWKQYRQFIEEGVMPW